MSQSLSEFIDEQMKLLAVFQKHWVEKHAEDPDNYPLIMEDGNEGLWLEQLQEMPLNSDPEQLHDH
ncbi:MAG: hypothetical protein ACK2UO_20350 [Caldilineaceae bacterium]